MTTSIKGERLREMRENQKVSQRELARMCGIGDVLIYRYENGISDPSLRNLVTIAEKLGVSIDYLVGLSDHPKGQAGDKEIEAEESYLLDTLRRDGWSGVIRLGADRLSK